MQQITTLVLGLAARGISLVSALFGDWLLGRLAEGRAFCLTCVRDWLQFGQWLVEAVAEHLAGRHANPSTMY